MRKCVLFLLCCSFAYCATAQVSFGVKAGLNLSGLTLDKVLYSWGYRDIGYDLGHRVGMSIGPTAKLAIPLGGLGIDLSVLYEQRNVSQTRPHLNGGPSFKTVIKQQMIAVPLHLRYDMAIAPTADLFVYTGPQVGINIGKDYDLDYGTWEQQNTTFCVNVGAGCTFKKYLQVSIGYSIGCGKMGEISINRSNRDGGEVLTEGRISSWQMGMTYYF